MGFPIWFRLFLPARSRLQRRFSFKGFGHFHPALAEQKPKGQTAINSPSLFLTREVSTLSLLFALKVKSQTFNSPQERKVEGKDFLGVEKKKV